MNFKSNKNFAQGLSSIYHQLTDVRDIFVGVEQEMHISSITRRIESSVHAEFGAIQIVRSARSTLTLFSKKLLVIKSINTIR